jgi:hypothetical protein
MDKIKKYSIIFSVVGLVLILTGVTYSFFNYTRVGLANNIRVGNVSFNTTQNGSISLTNVFPITSEELSTDVGNHDSVSVSIVGSTDHTGGVEYLVTFSDVNNTVNNKMIPIAYNVSSTNVGTNSNDYYGNRGGNSSIHTLSRTGIVKEGKYILVGYIASGQTGVNGSVTITAYVDANKMMITDTPELIGDLIGEKTVFSTSEWNSLKNSNALSFKIKVEARIGTWVVEESTPASCFTTTGPRPEYAIKEMTGTRLTTCTDYFANGGFDISSGSYEDFCLGTAKYYNDTFQDVILLDRFDDYVLGQLVNLDIIEQVGYKTTINDYDISCGTDVSIPAYMNTSYQTYEFNSSVGTTEINDCVDYITNYMGWGVDTDNGETMQAFCSGTGTMWGQTFQEQLNYNNFDSSNLEYFVSHDIVNREDHNVPNTKVVKLEGEYDDSLEADRGAFMDKGLTSVKLPNTLVIIGSYSFDNNNLTSVVVPNGVLVINQNAFSNNQLTSLSLPDNIRNIYIDAFSNNNLATITIPRNIGWIYPSGIFTNNPITTVIVDGEIGGEGNNDCTDAYIGFYNVFTIQNVIITDRVSYVGKCAFYNKDVQSVTFGSGITRIEDGAFKNNSITTLNIPDNVTSIGTNAFYGEEFKNVTVGSGITSIGNSAFSRSGSNTAGTIRVAKSCSALKSMATYPWISLDNRTGSTIYGLNDEVCDSW